MTSPIPPIHPTPPTSPAPRVSIIINNYNYAGFLAAAIESALAQAYAPKEVIVVDDGSTDGSREVLSGYAGRVLAVLKANGGQASAFRAGLGASQGEVILFLDADDLLYPEAAAVAASCFADPRVVKASWPLEVIDGQGQSTGETLPPRQKPLPEGDLADSLLRTGPDSYLSPPTSGNAWSRGFLEAALSPSLLADQEAEYRQGADGYLITLAPLFGHVRAINRALGAYRIHGRNQFWSGSLADRNAGALLRYERRHRTLARVVRERGLAADIDAWKLRNGYYQWMRKLDHTLKLLEQAVPADATVILADEDQCGGTGALSGRRIRPFLESGGQYAGPPADDAAAIRELERMRGQGAAMLAIAWPAFWWLDHYREFARHLAVHYPKTLENDLLVIHDLRSRS